MYLSKLVLNSEHFYMHPLQTAPVDDTKPWYTRQRVGVNTIKQFLPKICSGSGTDAKYTNHSLRATAITRMFNGNIPEKVIAEKSGHKSTKALRCYEKTSLQQEQVTGNIISGLHGIDVPKQEPNLETATMIKKDHKPNPVHEFSGTLNNCTINIINK